METDHNILTHNINSSCVVKNPQSCIISYTVVGRVPNDGHARVCMFTVCIREEALLKVLQVLFGQKNCGVVYTSSIIIHVLLYMGFSINRIHAPGP